MMREFISKHRKLLSITGVILAAIIITVTTIGVVNNVTAGVYKGDSDKQKEAKNNGNRVIVLEIVSQYGQQVLGYTVPGFEPITKEAIENYPTDGPADLSSAAFTNATGWEVKKTSDGYKVTGSLLDDAFSKNVFASALNTVDAESDSDEIVSDIEIRVKQANDVTMSDINESDLIYINNAKENDSNVLYFYDQVMNYDVESNTLSDSGIQPGEIGKYYDDISYETLAASEVAVRLIKESAGKDSAYDIEETIAGYFKKAAEAGSKVASTKSVFEVAGVKDYHAWNHGAYIETLRNAEKGSISDLDEINTLIAMKNDEIQNDAIEVIKSSAGKKLSVSEKEDLRTAFIEAYLVDTSTGMNLYIEENFDKYVSYLEGIDPDGLYSGRSSINTAIKYINGNESSAARAKVIACSGQGIEETIANVDEALMKKCNFDSFKEVNLNAYLQAIASEKLNSESDVLKLVEKVNTSEKLTAKEKIETAVKNQVIADTLTLVDFEKADIKSFDKDLIECYKEELVSEETESFVKEFAPEYDDAENINFVAHFRTSKKNISLVDFNILKKVEDASTESSEESAVEEESSSEEESDIYVVEDTYSMMYESDSNDYYRVALSLKEATDYVVCVTYKDENGDDQQEVFVIPEITEDKKEYWLVVADEAKVFESVEAVVADTNFGEDFVYGHSVVSDEKIESFIAKANEKYYVLDSEVSYDFTSWEVAKTLVQYAENATSGLIASGKIISNIGTIDSNDWMWDNVNKQDAHADNNVYKSLLLIKLRSSNKLSASKVKTILNDITDEGVYKNTDKWSFVTFTNNTSNISTNGLYNRTYLYGEDICFNGVKFISRGDFNYTNEGMIGYGLTKWDAIEATKDVMTVNGSTKTLGNIVKYVMNMYVNELQNYPMNVLEVQAGSGDFELNSYEGAKLLADWLRIDYSDMTKNNYKDYFNVTSISVKEFNTRDRDLTADFDLIYFGVKSGYMNREQKSGVYRTIYNDSSMNGYVYTGIGDIFDTHKFMRGTAVDDYQVIGGTYSGSDYSWGSIMYNPKKESEVWKKYFTEPYGDDIDQNKTYAVVNSRTTTRVIGNDITMKRYDDLMEYLKAGFPILMVDELINSDNYKDGSDRTNSNVAEWTYLDKDSKLYNFIKDAKALGYNSSMNAYTGLDRNGNKVFDDGGKYASLVNVKYARNGLNPDDLSNKFEGGLQFATKRNVRVTFDYVSGPIEYNKDSNGNILSSGSVGNTIKYGTTDYSRYQVLLKLTSDVEMDWLEENFEFQMYIDKSGSGRFSEENTVEIDPEVDFNYKGKMITMEGNWPAGNDGTMDGFVPWRIEAYSKTNPKNHFVYTGFSAFEKVDTEGNPTKKDIEVLWVKNENLTLNFADVINSYQNAGLIPEYNIKITTVNYKDFPRKGAWGTMTEDVEFNSSNSVLKVKYFDSSVSSDSERYDKEFDMLVFGYCDSYQGMDLNNIYCLQNIRYFVEAGHSLFFAHDNASYITTVMDYVSTSNNTKDTRVTSSDNEDNMYNFAKYTTAYMRDMLGMDVYGATYSPKAFTYAYLKNGAKTPISEQEALSYNESQYDLNPYYSRAVYNARLYTGTTDQKDFRGFTEGITLWTWTGNNGSGKPLYKTDFGKGGSWIGWDSYSESFMHTQKIRRINEGQLTMYPYVLDETLPTAKTHFQYLALNLEDEDTTVWYTLNASGNNQSMYKANNGDGANNYYIYSKGNVTYTGAGHAGGYTDEEKKLFINTVIAAIKAGNYGPEITFTNRESNTTDESVIYTYDTDICVDVRFRISDVDRKKNAEGAFSKVQIYFDKINLDSNGNPAGDDKNGQDAIRYDASEDILINNPDKDIPSDYMMDSKGQIYINMNEQTIKNRAEQKFTLSYVDLANLYCQIHNISDTYALVDGAYTKNGAQGSYGQEVQDLVKEFFNEYRIAVTATDIPKSTNVNVEGITKTAVARVGFRSLFNLN